MQVILFENVEKLGMQGDIVNVAAGYYRNFLGPFGKAIDASPANMKRLEAKRNRLRTEAQKQISAAEGLAQQLGKVKITFVMKSPDGTKLFGSIHDHQVHEQLVELGFEQIDRRQIMLQDPIKTVGTHSVKIRLIGNVDAHIKVIVEPEGGVAVEEEPAAEAPAEAAQTPEADA